MKRVGVTGITLDLFGTAIEPIARGVIHEKRRAEIRREFFHDLEPAASEHRISVAYSETERYIKSLPLLACASPEQTRGLLLEHLSMSDSVQNRGRIDSALAAALDGAFRVLPGAREFVSHLRESGLKVAVVTNVEWESSADVENILDALQLQVDAVVTSTTVGYFKPRPEPFIAAARALNASPEELMHIGDDYVADYLGASAAGLSVCLLSPGGSNFDSRHIRECESFITLLPDVLASNR